MSQPLSQPIQYPPVEPEAFPLNGMDDLFPMLAPARTFHPVTKMACRTLCGFCVYFAVCCLYDGYVEINLSQSLSTCQALKISPILEEHARGIRLVRVIVTSVSFWLLCDLPMRVGHYLWHSTGYPMLSFVVPSIILMLPVLAPCMASMHYTGYGAVVAILVLSCGHLCMSCYKLMCLQTELDHKQLEADLAQRHVNAVNEKAAAAQALIDAFNADSPEDPAAHLAKCQALLDAGKQLLNEDLR